MKRSGVNILIQSFLLFILFIALGMTSVAFAHFEVQSWGVGDVVYWKVKVSDGQSFKDFHVWTDDLEHFGYPNVPDGWEYDEVEVADNRGWLSFWGSRAIDHDTVFQLEYWGDLNVKNKAKWKITDDGNKNPDDGVIKEGKNAHSALRTAVPTLTEWGLIIFGVVLVGFITWVFLRRRKAVVSIQ